MSKNIKEFIHYYINQKCRVKDFLGNWQRWKPVIPYYFNREDIQLALRKLEDMTEEEAKGFLLIVQGAEAKYKSHNETAVFYSKPGVWAGDSWFIYNAPEAFHYLLQLGFDLFGLIDAGLAIDAKTINHQQ